MSLHNKKIMLLFQYGTTVPGYFSPAKRTTSGDRKETLPVRKYILIVEPMGQEYRNDPAYILCFYETITMLYL